MASENVHAGSTNQLRMKKRGIKPSLFFCLDKNYLKYYCISNKKTYKGTKNMNILNLEDEKFKTVKVYGYSFKVRYISPLDRANIIRHRMKLQAGNPIESLTADDYLYFENIAICDTCIETFPEGFTEHESSLKWDDIHLINGVAGEIRKHTEEIEAKLKKNRPAVGVV